MKAPALAPVLLPAPTTTSARRILHLLLWKINKLVTRKRLKSGIMDTRPSCFSAGSSTAGPEQTESAVLGILTGWAIELCMARIASVDLRESPIKLYVKSRIWKTWRHYITHQP